MYPWGDEFDKARCNTKESGINSTSAVDRFPKGRSPYGCYDMAGNVWEWTSSFFNDEADRMAVRGGSWLLNHTLARCASRVKTLPYDWYLSLGFRCVRDKE
jgi:formylglycine-generating enzyme required for sulfatase activity